jgi:hypothetical protein
VSFLAIPNSGSVTAVAALVSTITALGSVLSGLYCLAYYAYEDPAGDIVEISVCPYLFFLLGVGLKSINIQNRYAANILSHGKNRPVYTAVILSLPEASLLWSIISFAVAALAFNFSARKFSVGFILVLIVFGIVALGVGLVLGALWYVWGTGSIATRVWRFFHKFLAGIGRRDRMGDNELT